MWRARACTLSLPLTTYMMRKAITCARKALLHLWIRIAMLKSYDSSAFITVRSPPPTRHLLDRRGVPVTCVLHHPTKYLTLTRLVMSLRVSITLQALPSAHRVLTGRPRSGVTSSCGAGVVNRRSAHFVRWDHVTYSNAHAQLSYLVCRSCRLVLQYRFHRLWSAPGVQWSWDWSGLQNWRPKLGELSHANRSDALLCCLGAAVPTFYLFVHTDASWRLRLVSSLLG